MYQSVFNNVKYKSVEKENDLTLISIGNKVNNNINFGSIANIDVLKFIKVKNFNAAYKDYNIQRQFGGLITEIIKNKKIIIPSQEIIVKNDSWQSTEW